MNDGLKDMHLFVALCRARNFRRAAAAMQMPSSTLSRRIARLEKDLDLRLVNRSSRTFGLTEEGENYLARIAPLIDELAFAHGEARDGRFKPSGLLRVSMPHGLATGVGMKWLAEFAAQYPEISYEINTEPSNVDILADRFDVVIDQHYPLENQLLVRRGGSFTFNLYASRDYVERNGAPAAPEDLSRHECIRVNASRDMWTLYRDGVERTVPITGRFLCDATVLARPLALAGQGIARLLQQTSAPDEAAGRLVRILPEWTCDTVPLLLITPTKLLPRRSRLFVDFMGEKLRLFETMGA